MTDQQQLTLHTYFRSSCSARVRTACHLKDIPLQYVYVNLLKGEHKDPTYTSTLNPGALLPTLTITSGDTHPVSITQSVAILEYLEEAFPSARPLLPPPSQPLARARVREMVNVIATDTQPPTNMRVLRRVNALGVASPAWCGEYMGPPLGAYERLVEAHGGRYSFGDEVTLADVCLAPAVEGALRWGVDLSGCPRLMAVFERVKGLEAFWKGDWRGQEDTPEELRGGR